MSVFLVKTLKIRGDSGLCPQISLTSGGWGLRPLNPGCAPPLCRILAAPLYKPMKFCPLPRNFGLATPLNAANYALQCFTRSKNYSLV